MPDRKEGKEKDLKGELLKLWLGESRGKVGKE